MKILIFTILFALACLLGSPPKSGQPTSTEIDGQNYALIFGADYQQALLTYAQQSEKWKKYFITKQEFEVMSAVVFPELIRYSQVQDLMETEVLTVAYIQQGSQLCDFSIGQFQIKPSFLEKVESYFEGNEHFAYLKYPKREKSSHEAQSLREQRLQRLENFHWQLCYLHCFYVLMEGKTQHLLLSTAEKINLYATAYNAGFEHTLEQLDKKKTESYFPYGKNFEGKQYNYAAISVQFFEKLH